MTNANITLLNRLDPASQRRLVEAVRVEARRMRAETLRDLLRQSPRVVYRAIVRTAQIARKIIAGLVQRAGHRADKSLEWEM